ncbi:hypothetical protein [Gordonia sp. SL306]|uniref:hypothetical protein n=1 Tax=Gordonia sp. SL306 TaxID=2995145 RepID=UPI002270686A|nr:hypothetical protein [Gordonia sp. SL306]WAC55964.1 hypothetical protein OVA31_01440 [Gordonia sp. SL306]
MPKSQRPNAAESDADAVIGPPRDDARDPGEVTPLDGDDFLAVNRTNRERLREEARQKAERESRRRGRQTADGSSANGSPDAAADEGDGSGGAAADRTPGRVMDRPRPTTMSRRSRVLVVGLSVLVVVLAATTAYFAYAAHQADRRADASGPSEVVRQDAMDSARRYAAAVATYDPANYGDLDRRIHDIATAEFAKSYITSSQDARRGNAAARGTSRAASKEAGLQSISHGKAVVLVTLDQTVTSPQVSAEVPEGIPYQSRVKVTLERRDGRWLLSDLDTV